MTDQLWIKGIIINASFPRSGNGYLRNLLINFFDTAITYYDSYTRKLVFGKGRANKQDANIIKTHDLNLCGREILRDIVPTNRKYLIQIRQPLEAIASYYDYSVKHDKNLLDNEENWLEFLEDKLSYWKGFYDLWIRPNCEDSCILFYDDLCKNTFLSLLKIIKFMTGTTDVDSTKITEAIKEVRFLRYDEDTKESTQRDITQFKYYDRESFDRINSDIKNYFT